VTLPFFPERSLKSHFVNGNECFKRNGLVAHRDWVKAQSATPLEALFDRIERISPDKICISKMWVSPFFHVTVACSITSEQKPTLGAEYDVCLKLHTRLEHHTQYKPNRGLHESPACMHMCTCTSANIYATRKM